MATKGKELTEGEGNNEPTEEQPKFMTVKDLNGALTSHTRRMTETFEKMVKEAMTPIVERFNTQPAPEGTAERKPEGNSDEVKTQLQQLTQRLERAEKQRDEERKLREAERTERMRAEEVSTLTDTLRGVGVTDPVLLNAARAMLRDKVARDKEGRIIVKANRDGIDEEITVSDFAKDWAKSDEGKRFLPPREVKGAGAGGFRNAPKGRDGTPDGLIPRDQATQIIADTLSGVLGQNGVPNSET